MEDIRTGKSFPFSEFREDPRFPHVRTIRTKVRRVTKRNEKDGLDRQQIIRQCCESGDALYLEREPDNPVGRSAIKVRRIVCTDAPDKPRLGEQIGYHPHDLAEDLAPRMDKHGHVLLAKVLNVTGHEDGHSLGVNIQIEEYKPAAGPLPPAGI